MDVLRLNQAKIKQKSSKNQAKIADQNNNKCYVGTATHILLY